MTDDGPLFVVLETTTSTTGKASWAVWRREANSHKYSMLIARVYDSEWADRITALLNVNERPADG